MSFKYYCKIVTIFNINMITKKNNINLINKIQRIKIKNIQMKIHN